METADGCCGASGGSPGASRCGPREPRGGRGAASVSRRGVGVTRGGGCTIRGNLKDVALSSLLQAMHVESASGSLHLEGGGELHLVRGEIVAASTERADGYDAVMSLLARRRGSFRFEGASPRGTDPRAPLAPIMNLLLESARLDDEWQRVAGNVPRVIDPARIPVGDRCLTAVIPWMDGRRTMSELAHLSGASTTELIAALRSGLSRGAIERIRSAEAAGERDTPEPDRGFEELLLSARSRIREGDLEGATRLLHRALARRPEDRIARQNLRRVAALLSSRRERPRASQEKSEAV